MPLFIKNFEWTQNLTTVILKVPLKAHKNEEGIILWKKFLKINVRPYFFEVFFEHPIDIEQSTCKIVDSGVVCTLKKIFNENWSRLGKFSKAENDVEAISTDEKGEIWREYEVSVAQDIRDHKMMLDAMKRTEIDKEMERQQSIRQKIDQIQKILKDQHIQQQPCDVRNYVQIPQNQLDNNRNKAIKQKSPAIKALMKPEKIMPPIRKFTEINVKFSERRFVTPKRESQDYAEQEWCAKQKEYMTSTVGFCDADLNDDERDPVWLLNKGNEFFEKNNMLAAVSAYSSGLQLANQSPDLYLARANAHFPLANYKRCIEDCTEAYGRFQPPVVSNLKQRIQCLELRGKSLIEIGYQHQGESELKIAGQLALAGYKGSSAVLN